MASYNDDLIYEIKEKCTHSVHNVPVLKGDFYFLPDKAQKFVTYCVDLMKPRAIVICDGSQEEADQIIEKLVERGTLTKLTAYHNNYLCRTDPSDVARVESKTFLVTRDKYASVPHVREGVTGIMAHWMSPLDMKREMDDRFPFCMTGRVMYVIPFCMGPVGSSFSKYAVQVTDSSYVVLSMRIMARVGHKVISSMDDNFIRCMHSVGCPKPMTRRVQNHWLCNPEKVIIAHFPEERKVKSFGSGYGGNSLLGKKCLALRIASVMAKDEGWLAEHMLIMSITTPENKEFFVAAAFPSACGKTNLAMMKPTLPGFKIHCIGDDIAWLKFDSNGLLRAVNPENGFFGVAPGTNSSTNPNAMMSFQKNSLFTNVAETEDGRFFWEGLEAETSKFTKITNWEGREWCIGDKSRAAHPNSRFTCPAVQCPIIHPRWADPLGFPISAIIFGGRRPKGVPLVFEARSWSHGVLIGACLKSEATAAAEDMGKRMVHDPMAMRPFIGYNFGDYLQHWLDMEKPGRQMPKIFHVNWFRTNHKGKYIWPGFGENIRVLQWILRRCEEDNSIVIPSPIGGLPRLGSIDTSGLPPFDEDELFSVPSAYWLEDIQESRKFMEDQVGIDTPPVIFKMLKELEEDISNVHRSTNNP